MPEVLDDDRVRRNALKAYREGRVTIRSIVFRDEAALRAIGVAAKVRGYNGLYEIDYDGHRWACTCGVDIGCPHVRAVQLVTGHAGAPLLTATAPHPSDPPDTTDGDQETTRLLGLRGWTPAAFEGRCARCSLPYDRGVPIRAISREDQQFGTVWAGPCCGEQ
jgi:hypothetical protein